jgi:hypothetical protein
LLKVDTVLPKSDSFFVPGCTALGIAEDELKKIVLEKDGTQVTDADYFDSLPDQTVFLFLKEGQEWVPNGHDM